MRRALAHLALALIATFPGWLTPLSRLIGHEDVDVWNHAWGPWWFWRTLGTGTLPWRTDLLFSPRGGVLWYIDPLGALAGAPLVGLVGPVGAYNAVAVAWVALTSVAAHRLARALGAGETAWIASIAAVFSPFLLSELHDGVTEAAGVQWALFTLAATARAQRGGSWLAVGAWLALTAVGTWYYALGTAVILAAWSLAERHVRGPLLAGVVAAALFAPVALAVRTSVEAEDALVVRAEFAGDDREMLLSHNAVDPRAFVAPLGFQSVDLAARGEAFRHSSYAGLVALALAFAARRPRVLLGAALAAVLSLGPWLWWGGRWVEVDGHRLALPFRALLTVLPEAVATHAQRVGWPALGVVAALAAVGAARVSRRAQVVAGLAVAVDALSSSPWPLARTPALDTHAHTALTGAGVVLDLPAEVGASMATSRYLAYQAAGGHPIPYRPDARAGTCSLLGTAPFWVLALPSLHRPEHRARLAQFVDALETVDVRLLVEQGVRYIVVHRELERGAQGVEQLERQLRAWLGEPAVDGSHAVWTLGEDAPRRGVVLRGP